MSKVTRRELAVAVSASALLAARPAPAQSVSPPSAQNNELDAVRMQFHQLADQLDQFPLPMDAEPATIFKP